MSDIKIKQILVDGASLLVLLEDGRVFHKQEGYWAEWRMTEEIKTFLNGQTN